MEITDLQFNKTSTGRWEASFVSSGAVTIQIKRVKYGSMNIYANIDGMERSLQRGDGYYNEGSNSLFRVDVPAGLTVTIESLIEVLSAKLLSDE